MDEVVVEEEEIVEEEEDENDDIDDDIQWINSEEREQNGKIVWSDKKFHEI